MNKIDVELHKLSRVNGGIVPQSAAGLDNSSVPKIPREETAVEERVRLPSTFGRGTEGTPSSPCQRVVRCLAAAYVV